jgi:hypothetical protein
MCDVKIFLTFTSPNMVLLLTTILSENCENRNDPDLVQAFLKKWWIESDFKAPNLPLSLRFALDQHAELDFHSASSLRRSRRLYSGAEGWYNLNAHG